jgi:putative transposase
MKKMEICALYRKPNLSKADQSHCKYPYLLKERVFISLESDFCIEALNEAIKEHGIPEI